MSAMSMNVRNLFHVRHIDGTRRGFVAMRRSKVTATVSLKMEFEFFDELMENSLYFLKNDAESLICLRKGDLWGKMHDFFENWLILGQRSDFCDKTDEFLEKCSIFNENSPIFRKNLFFPKIFHEFSQIYQMEAAENQFAKAIDGICKK